MKSLSEGTVGTTYTVQKVKGGRSVVELLENMGVAAGSDIIILGTEPDGGLRLQAEHREISLAAEYKDQIVIGAHFVRECGDPLLMGGCCSGGSTGDMWDRLNE